MTPYREPRPSAIACARCKTEGVADKFYHSADGLLCPACFRDEKVSDRRRTARAEGSVDAMMNGLLALAAGFGCFIFGILGPADTLAYNRGARLFALGISVTIVAIVRAVRFPDTIERAALWKTVAFVGGALLSFGVLAVFLRSW